MFTQDEAKALAAAVRLAEAWLDPALALQAQGGLGKIMSVLPADARAAAESLVIYAPYTGLSEAAQRTLQTLREAAQSRRKLYMTYEDLNEQQTQRTVRPLGCFYWGKVWTLAGWCEHRDAFRSFRVDRIRYVRTLPDTFRDEPGRTLADLLREEERRCREASQQTANLAIRTASQSSSQAAMSSSAAAAPRKAASVSAAR